MDCKYWFSGLQLVKECMKGMEFVSADEVDAELCIGLMDLFSKLKNSIWCPIITNTWSLQNKRPGSDTGHECQRLVYIFDQRMGQGMVAQR